MTRINYLSDFKLLLTLKVNGEPIDFDTLSVRLVFSASGLPYECRSAGWVNCIDQGDGKLLCLFNRHKLGKGALQCLMYVCEADAQMPDGDMVQVMPLDLDVELVTGAGDNTIGEATVELSALYRLLVESASAAQVAARNAADSMSAAAASADDAGDAAVLARAAQVAAERAAERAEQVDGYTKAEANALLKGKADKVPVVDVSGTEVTQELAPNTFYRFGTVDALSLTMATAPSGTLAIYACSFTAASDNTTLTLPATVKGEAPTIAAGHRYELNIMDNVLLYTENGND